MIAEVELLSACVGHRLGEEVARSGCEELYGVVPCIAWSLRKSERLSLHTYLEVGQFFGRSVPDRREPAITKAWHKPML